MLVKYTIKIFINLIALVKTECTIYMKFTYVKATYMNVKASILKLISHEKAYDGLFYSKELILKIKITTE